MKETRAATDGGVRRRRRCPDCHHDFQTIEHVSGERLRVCKSDGREEMFERSKLRRGIVKAAVRPHHSDRLTELVESIAQEAHQIAHDEYVDSAELAELTLRHLREFDEVTHVRFALTQRGRRDQQSRLRGWKRSADFRKWLTREYPRLEHSNPPGKLSVVVKRDDRREPYDRTKMERSIGVASKGRGTGDAQVHDFATQVADIVEHTLGSQAMVTSGQIAAEVIRALRAADHIAAIRYASTFKRFSAVEDYEIEALGLRGLKSL
ncbi:MAG: ATP cone domain-containing protein [Microthrixaceae bacterium]|nr:ATP cone domain-containing protein [Microthrixaceae bacterium]